MAGYRRPLVFVGTRSDMEPLIEIAEENNIPILGVVDRFYTGQKFHGLDVIGSDLDLLDKNNTVMQDLVEQADFFVASFFGGVTNVHVHTENTFHLRLERIDIVQQARCNLVNLIHPGADISRSAKLGRNILACRGVIIESHVKVGSFSQFMYNNIISHHAEIGTNCIFLAGNTGCTGGVKFGNNVVAGIESKVLNSGDKITVIGNNVIIGPKVMIFKDIPDDSIVQVNGKIIKNTYFTDDAYQGVGLYPTYQRLQTKENNNETN